MKRRVSRHGSKSNAGKPSRDHGKTGKAMSIPDGASDSGYRDGRIETGDQYHTSRYECGTGEEGLIERLTERIRTLDETTHARISRLEDVKRLQNQNDESITQSLLAQNEQSIKDLERIFKIDGDSVYDPRELEGILADYSDSQSSTEWIRSIRDG